MPNDELQTASASPLPSAGNFPSSAASSSNVRNASAQFGNVPQVAESFRTVRNDSESFRNIPHTSARSENHTLRVREVARMFEAAGVARSERSVTNWCQPNRQGIARLDAYFDPNDRRYFITPQSVEAVITEEKAKAAKTNAEPLPQASEEFRNPVPQPTDSFGRVPNTADNSATAGAERELAELQKEITDLRITNRGKDYFIEQMRSERESLLKQLVDSSQRNGQLEAMLMQLAAPDVRGGGEHSTPTDEMSFPR